MKLWAYYNCRMLSNKFNMSQQVQHNTFSKTFCTHKKPKFLTKYKLRSTKREASNKEFSNDFDIKKFRSKTEMSENTEQDVNSELKCKLSENEGDGTSRRLEAINFSHHNPNSCVCDDCTCGRHLCQLHCIKPDLTKKSTYNKDFFVKRPIKNNINISTEYDRLKGPNLDLNTVYIKDYEGKKFQIERPKPEDCLKMQGPMMNLTSYSSNFPGHRGDNQYVKPTDNHTRGAFPMRCRTTYSHSFTGTRIKRRGEERAPDNLKTGLNWYGKTTYSNTFIAPNPEYFAAKHKHVQKAEQIPAYNKHQIETNYKSNYICPERKVCPAKIKIEKSVKDFYSKDKSRFNQNTDFKCLDSSFRPFSASKIF